MWKDIKNYEGLYQISEYGQVRRIMRNGKYRDVKNREGVYYTVSLSKKGVKKSHNVHRLVAEAFIVKPEGATEVNHKDGNKFNNFVGNLEWVTQYQNLQHSIIVLNHYPWGKPPKEVVCRDIDTNNVVAEYRSVSDAARAIGKMSARTSITHVCQGLQQTAYGYKWEYKEREQ